MQPTYSAKVQKLSKIKNNLDMIPAKAGVYKFFINKEGLNLLKNVVCSSSEVINNKKIYLLYVGLSKDLKYRFKWHLGFVNSEHSNILNGTLSTFRFSLMANNSKIDCLSQQNILNDFMDSYMYLQYLVTDNYELIEKNLIEKYKPPLNIKDNTNEFVHTNRSRRRYMINKYKNNKITSSDSLTVRKNIQSTSIDYGKNGKFVNTITEEIINFSKQIHNNKCINIDLGVSGGYIANNICIVISDNEDQFSTDLLLKDKSKFPARVKNLAIALKRLEFYGKYRVSHDNGILDVQKIL